ncbi:unnamed protein product [Gadus morhua 'NCC']
MPLQQLKTCEKTSIMKVAEGWLKPCSSLTKSFIAAFKANNARPDNTSVWADVVQGPRLTGSLSPPVEDRWGEGTRPPHRL